MRRREFIAALGGAAAWPVMARPQQSGSSGTSNYLLEGAAVTLVDQHDELLRRHWRGRLRPPAGRRRAITIIAMILSSAVAVR